MEKSPDAFRTISEVADWLGVPTHVLRFWESRFPQVKPVKRAGGRRYYRPADMLLLGGIKQLLHDDGMTIRGVQKMLREEGVKHVSSFSQPLDAVAPMRDVTPREEEVPPSPMAVDVEPEPLDNVVPMAAAPSAPEAEGWSDHAEPEPPLTPEPEAAEPERPLNRTPEAAETAGPDMTSEAADPADPDREPPAEPWHPEDALQSPAEDLAPEAAAPEPGQPEEEGVPEFSFLRRAPAAQGAATAAAPPPPDGAAPASDLFSSRRSAEPAQPAEPPRPRIPATPDVPAADAPDDDASTPAFPGVAARLLAGHVRPDHAAIARAVADLRDLRARL